MVWSEISWWCREKGFICGMIRGIVVWRRIVRWIIDIGEKCGCGWVYSGEWWRRESGDRNVVIKVRRNWVDGNVVIVEWGNMVEEKVEFRWGWGVIVRLRGMEVGWLGCRIVVVMVGVEVGRGVVIVEEVWGEWEDVGEVGEELKRGNV